MMHYTLSNVVIYDTCGTRHYFSCYTALRALLTLLQDYLVLYYLKGGVLGVISMQVDRLIPTLLYLFQLVYKKHERTSHVNVK